MRRIAALAATLLSVSCMHGSPSAPAANSEVYALRYATLRGFPVASLIAGADTARRSDIAMSVWLIKRSDGRLVLVDAGFYREKFMQRWKPADYSKPEFTHHVSDAGKVLDRTVDSVDAVMFANLNRAGRLRFIDGDDQEVMPGIRVYTGGKHTFASEFVGVRMAAGTIVLASDNAYLYENFDRHVPISQTLDAASNLRAQDRMLTLASDRRLIVPGHDPAVFTRFPTPGNGVARIQ